MNFIYFLILPTLAVTLWALHTKYRQGKITDLVILLALGVAVYLNVFLVYESIVSGLSVISNLVQMTAASVIIPLAYLYFARQVGRQTANNTASTMLWLLILLNFIPEIILCSPFEQLILPKGGLLPFNVYVISHGNIEYDIRTGDLVNILQCFVSILRIIPFMLMLRKHNLHLNRKVYSFFTCWALIIVFVVMVSSMTTEELHSTFGTIFYFSFYSMLLILVNTLIANGYDLYPVETEENEAVEDLSVYVQQQYGAIASKMRVIMEDQKLYTDPQVTASSVIELLNTNHTYFSKMMESEWGMSFSEYLNSLRLKHVKQLLSDDSLTISNVATQSGFADAGYMSRKFKAKYGITPSEWRKRLSTT